MSFKQKRWDSLEKASIPIVTLVDRHLSACRSAITPPQACSIPPLSIAAMNEV